MIQLSKSIQSFYLSCTSGHYIKFVTQKAYFSDVYQNRTFFVYIIPIISVSSSGEVKNLTIQMSLASIQIIDDKDYRLHV